MPALIVDDNASYRQILIHMLSGWGMEPVAVASATAALEALRTARVRGDRFPSSSRTSTCQTSTASRWWSPFGPILG